MGNCQAIDAASLVIQHPNGRVERLYWPVTANEVMKSNPTHYVALIITTTVSAGAKNVDDGVRVTRVKLLKPTDILALGHAYRLIDSQEVMKGLWAKKYAKMKKKNELESAEKPPSPRMTTSEVEVNQAAAQAPAPAPAQEKHRQRLTPSSASVKGKQWRPSLQSISEAGLSQQAQKTAAAAKTGNRRTVHYQRKDVFQSS